MASDLKPEKRSGCIKRCYRDARGPPYIEGWRTNEASADTPRCNVIKAGANKDAETRRYGA